MSKENMDKFFEKIAATPALAEKLKTMQKQYTEQIVALAKENGFDVTPEDFTETLSCLNDEEIETVSGGYNPRFSPGSYTGYDIKDVKKPW